MFNRSPPPFFLFAAVPKPTPSHGRDGPEPARDFNSYSTRTSSEPVFAAVNTVDGKVISMPHAAGFIQVRGECQCDQRARLRQDAKPSAAAVFASKYWRRLLSVWCSTCPSAAGFLKARLQDLRFGAACKIRTLHPKQKITPIRSRVSVDGAGVEGSTGDSDGVSSTQCGGAPLYEAIARIRPLLLILIALPTLQPDGTRLVKSLVPFVASQIQPVPSADPTTTPELFSEPSAIVVVTPPDGGGIALLPAVVPINA